MSIPRLLEAAKVLAYTDVGRWLDRAVTALRSGEGCDQALSLAGTAALDERDRHLRAAARAICPDSSDWRAAGELVHLLRYVQQHPHLLDRYPDLPPGQRDIAAALLCAPCPESQRRIWDCLVDVRAEAPAAATG